MRNACNPEPGQELQPTAASNIQVRLREMQIFAGLYFVLLCYKRNILHCFSTRHTLQTSVGNSVLQMAHSSRRSLQMSAYTSVFHNGS